MRRAALLCAALLAGCALLRPDAGEALQVRDIVAAATSGVRASPEEQRRQVTHAEQMFKALPDDANRARLGALLATLPQPWRDDARASALLEPLATRRPETPLSQLAGMLAAGSAERLRLARDLRAAERREEAAEERAATLRQQVEALKSIERSILEREERRRSINR
jgi:hypothetical protein